MQLPVFPVNDMTVKLQLTVCHSLNTLFSFLHQAPGKQPLPTPSAQPAWSTPSAGRAARVSSPPAAAAAPLGPGTCRVTGCGAAAAIT